MKFGDNLKNLRKLNKISQEKLAEKVGVSRQSVSKWECSESYPNMDNIFKLCDIFHCKINDLVHEELTDIDSLDEDIKMNVVKLKKEKQNKVKGLSKAIYVIARICKIITIIAIPIIIVSMIFLPYIINNIEVSEGKITFNGNESNLIVVEENVDNNSLVRLKVGNAVIADESNQEAIIKIKEVLTNNSKIQIIGYLETGSIFLLINLILYIIILNYLEKLFININNGDTPFTLENVNYIKKMAFLMIATIILPSMSGALFELILKTDLDIGFELFDVFQILFLFSMAYIFEYGYEIQLDSKGRMYGDENE